MAALPVVLALTDVHLAAAPAALVISTAAGALAVSALALQPLLAGRTRPLSAAFAGRPVRWHRAVGAVALILVVVHVVCLFVVEVDDTLFAMSPDGPTRARMALIATVALVLAVMLGAARERVRLSETTWRVLHGYLALVVIVLGIGHAVLTDGALDGVGTVVLVLFGATGAVAALYAHVARGVRGRRGRR